MTASHFIICGTERVPSDLPCLWLLRPAVLAQHGPNGPWLTVMHASLAEWWVLSRFPLQAPTSSPPTRKLTPDLATKAIFLELQLRNGQPKFRSQSTSPRPYCTLQVHSMVRQAPLLEIYCLDPSPRPDSHPNNRIIFRPSDTQYTQHSEILCCLSEVYKTHRTKC
jgi:hypothetical protein